MIQLSCLCGRVPLTLKARRGPINACNCTLCRKAGARWGDLHPSQVSVEGETRSFRRGDKAEPNAELRVCGQCGGVTHDVLTESAVAGSATRRWA